MAINITNPEVVRMVEAMAKRTGKSKTDVIRDALVEQEEKLRTEREERGRRAWEFLEQEVWPNLPPEVRGKSLTKEEEEEILGIGPEGF